MSIFGTKNRRMETRLPKIPTMKRRFAAYAFAGYHTFGSESVLGTRNPYHGLGPILQRIKGILIRERMMPEMVYINIKASMENPPGSVKRETISQKCILKISFFGSCSGNFLYPNP
jgi:hypothetical protein